MIRYAEKGYAAALEDLRGGAHPAADDIDEGGLWQHLGLDDGGREARILDGGEVPGWDLDAARLAVVSGYREAMEASR